MKDFNIVYEPEDDVLNIWLKVQPIEYGEDYGDMIVHFSKDDQPVYIEILFASRLFEKSIKPSKRKLQKDVASKVKSIISVSHRIK